jgi:hypothetical protein
MDRLSDFLADLRENWDDHYWWARHQALQAGLIAVIAGVLGLLFTWLELRMRAAITT